MKDDPLFSLSAKVQKERQVLIQRGVLSLPGGAQLKYAGFRSRQQLTSSRSKMTFQLIFLVRQTKANLYQIKNVISANFASSVSLLELNHETLPKYTIGSHHSCLGKMLKNIFVQHTQNPNTQMWHGCECFVANNVMYCLFQLFLFLFCYGVVRFSEYLAENGFLDSCFDMVKYFW